MRFTDGSTDYHNVDHFLGTPGARVPDETLAALFRQYADPVLPAGRADAIIEAIWTLDSAPDLGRLIPLLRTDP